MPTATAHLGFGKTETDFAQIGKLDASKNQVYDFQDAPFQPPSFNSDAGKKLLELTKIVKGNAFPRKHNELKLQSSIYHSVYVIPKIVQQKIVSTMSLKIPNLTQNGKEGSIKAYPAFIDMESFEAFKNNDSKYYIVFYSNNDINLTFKFSKNPFRNMFNFTKKDEASGNMIFNPFGWDTKFKNNTENFTDVDGTFANWAKETATNKNFITHSLIGKPIFGPIRGVSGDNSSEESWLTGSYEGVNPHIINARTNTLAGRQVTGSNTNALHKVDGTYEPVSVQDVQRMEDSYTEARALQAKLDKNTEARTLQAKLDKAVAARTRTGGTNKKNNNKRLTKSSKSKRKVSQVNKKDVLGKQRNVYKFIGDRKQYIKYKNEYVLLKKYKEMQKTKTKPKTKPKTKSKSKSKK